MKWSDVVDEVALALVYADDSVPDCSYEEYAAKYRGLARAAIAKIQELRLTVVVDDC